MSLLRIQNVSKFYKKKPALRSVDLIIKKGDIIGLVGPNGSGKTTLLKIILGLVHPSEGSIIFEEQSDENVSASIDGQGFIESFSGNKNLYLIAKFNGIPIENVRQEMSKAGLGQVRNLPVKKYSAGMKKRLELANLFLFDKDLLILDEPTNGLDIDGIIWLKEKIVELNKMGKTFLITSHSVEQLEKICNRVCFIKEGKLIIEEDIEKILMNYGNIENAYKHFTA